MMEYTIGFGILAIFVVTYFWLFARAQMNMKLLQRNELYYESLYEQNPDLVLTCDLDGNIISTNSRVEAYGYMEEEIINQPFIPHIVPNKLTTTLEHFEKAKNGISSTHESTILSKNGERVDMMITNLPIVVDQKVIGIYSIIKDINSLKRTQNALAEAESQYRNLTEDSLVGIYMIQDSKYVYVNRKLLELSGYEKEELIGLDAIELVHPEDRKKVVENMKKRLNKEGINFRDEYRVVKKDQSVLNVEVHGARTQFKGRQAIIGTVIDITERKKNEETIKYLAYHDTLTGLYNRNYVYNSLKVAIEDGDHCTLAVFFFDLDRFKQINESLGHATGDLLLKTIAMRLKNKVFPNVDLARNGGDEFIVCLPNVDRQEAETIAKQILQCFENPFSLNHYELYITPSIGISLYPYDGKDVDTLLKKADSAMYQAKQGGKNTYQFYSCGENDELTYERLEFETSFRKALDNKEFILYYQPKLDLKSGKMTGVEALIRWKHPENGFIPPLDFIPLAEETGLIIPLGEWILREACSQTIKWQNQGLPPIVMSVNLSVRQLYQPNLVEMIRNVLNETGLNPELLELEITESMLLDTEHGIKVLNELEGLGIKISLDDFGTGYSSLHYLKEIPIHNLKIDQSFVRGSISDPNDAAIVKTIIGMAHQLKLTVIAEGVETREHLLFLQRNLCDVAQGFLFSKPIPPEEIAEQYRNIEAFVLQNGLQKEAYKNEAIEKALQIARQELIDLIRLQQGMIFKYEKNNGVFIHTLCDGELLRKMGLIPEEIIGKELKEFFPKEEVERKIPFYEQAWEGNEVTYEGVMKDICYMASLRPVNRGGRVVEVIGSCSDITERKKIEKALKESEAKFRLITENMLDLIGIVDKKGIITYASPSHETILGRKPSYFEGKNILELCHPDDIPHVKEHFQEMLQTKSTSKVEFRLNHASGDWLNIEVTVNPVIKDDEVYECFVVVGRDVTERRRLEKLIKEKEE